MDALIVRAANYTDDTFLYEILQLCLSQQLGEYERTKAYEALLIKQCELLLAKSSHIIFESCFFVGDIGLSTKARATYESALENGIELGGVAKSAYVKDQAEAEASKGVLSMFKNIFPWSKK